MQGRYLRANIKTKTRDYSQYQQYASGITAKWVAEEVSVGNASALGNPKNPKTYWEKLSFQGDGNLSSGNCVLHNDGEVSPVLPLIGRAATSDDLQLLTVVANNASLSANDIWLSDVEHLGLSVWDTIERWKVLNTATITSSETTTHPYSYEGEFGYYETDQTYPEN